MTISVKTAPSCEYEFINTDVDFITGLDGGEWVNCCSRAEYIHQNKTYSSFSPADTVDGAVLVLIDFWQQGAYSFKGIFPTRDIESLVRYLIVHCVECFSIAVLFWVSLAALINLVSSHSRQFLSKKRL